ncbi:MAG: hypothetical protein J6Y60_00685 [Treponema sp.]|nr:hypothetical protein [Treponema sp.]
MKGNIFLRTAFILLFPMMAQLAFSETIASAPRINAPAKEEKPVEKPVKNPLFAKDSFAGLVAGYHIKNDTPESQKILGQTIFQADSRVVQIFVGLQIQYKQVYLSTQLQLRPFTFDNVRLAFVAMGNIDFYDLSRIDTCQLAGLSLEVRPNKTVFFQTSCLFLLNLQTLDEIIDKYDYLHPEHCICAGLSLSLNFPKIMLTFSASTYERFLYRAYENQSYKVELSFTPYRRIQMTLSATARMHDLFILNPTYDETEVSLAIKYLF